MLKTISRAKLNVEYFNDLKKKVSRFLDEAKIEESALIMDGPGLGCASNALVLPLLGLERLLKFQDIHCFSASGYGLFWYHAYKTGNLKYTPDSIRNWNKDNQKAHGLRFPFLHIPFVISRKLLGRKYLFDIQTKNAIHATVSQDYASKKMKEFPHNFHFWAHNNTDNKIEAFDALGPLNELTPGEVMQATTAIPHLYEPFAYKEKVYKDALFCPQIRNFYRELCGRYKSVLFVHMGRDGIKENVHFIKAHPHGGPITRVVIDYLYFVAALENHEFNAGMKYFLTTDPL